ncbi:hypothetical protein CRE_18167 [Caenorhabditis remanei]|uniref:Uncharacterized protein n=1 Tax=Caenorhabditis remanei TaxID=31234 RepID=E3N8L3_CAERE|nr:hypothetical protein CRE_18167 [Caenorhabditis remanei]
MPMIPPEEVSISSTPATQTFTGPEMATTVAGGGGGGPAIPCKLPQYQTAVYGSSTGYIVDLNTEIMEIGSTGNYEMTCLIFQPEGNTCKDWEINALNEENYDFRPTIFEGMDLNNVPLKLVCESDGLYSWEGILPGQTEVTQTTGISSLQCVVQC